MPGYKNRFINLTFPDLSEDGDTVYVSIRSPRTVPPSQLQPVSLPENADGTPVDPRAAEKAMYDVIAGLIVSWHVYDGTSLDDDQPLLTLPATADSVGRLPLEIINRIGEEIGAAANPR